MIPSEIRLSGTPSFSEVSEVFIREYTKPGEMVLDPFAGSGTTMATAIDLGRRGLGVEIVPELAAAIRERLGPDTVVVGDSRRLDTLELPTADLVMTSPPFMTVTHHPQNPLAGYQTMDGDYQRYLGELASIVQQLATLVRRDGRIVLDVWNFWHGELFTPLADDVEAALSGVLPLEQNVAVTWGTADTDAPDDRCLVYRVG